MKKPNKSAGGAGWSKGGSALLIQVTFLLVVLGVLFWRSFLPDYVHFSNDGPLGQQNTAWARLPGGYTGMWDDLNDVGYYAGAFTPSLTTLAKWIFGPVGYAKFYIPFALFTLGLGAWSFFRALRLTPLAAALGGLATMLSATFFAGACWGVASAEIAVGINFFALALVTANTEETPSLTRWIRLALAGCCIGLNVIEASDIGALCSIFVAAYVFFKSIFDGTAALPARIFSGVIRVAVIAIFAGFLAYQALISLISVGITGVAITDQNTQSDQQRWDYATQWSLPKIETLGIFIPGLFGYKMDTPQDMQPSLHKTYNNGVYWGGIGRDPNFDRFLDSGAPGNPPQALMRFGYAGYYCGILVVLLALWAMLQSFRGANSIFTPIERKFIWFWSAVTILSLLCAWGRFAPMFYGTLYHLPYFSTIRNPTKFIIFLSWGIAVLFGYGVHALNRRYLDASGSKALDLVPQLQSWWSKAGSFDRNWFYGCASAVGLSLVGYFVFSAKMPAFVQYLALVGYPGDNASDPDSGAAIAAFSLGQYAWFIVLFAIAVVLVIVVLSGYFSGARAKLGMVLLTGFFLFDLGRANLPWVIHWDYKQKYEIGTLNPIVDFLRDKPYEHRVAALPFNFPQEYQGFSQLYRIEWMQHHFPYYDIQCLDIIQMARMAEDLKTYLENLAPRDQSQAWLIARHWQLTNTRYLLGPAGYLDILNRELDPAHQSFRILKRFDVALKPGITRDQFNGQPEQFTVEAKDDGGCALFEYGNALPRAKLYGNWQVNTNDAQILGQLTDLAFDPQKSVLISTPQSGLPTVSTNENSGTVDITSYSSKKLVLDATATAPSVLLLNDKYDPQWSVTVDGQPASLLHCNYLMQGVQVPSGHHTIQFQLTVKPGPLIVSLIAFAGAAILGIGLFFVTRK